MSSTNLLTLLVNTSSFEFPSIFSDRRVILFSILSLLVYSVDLNEWSPKRGCLPAFRKELLGADKMCLLVPYLEDSLLIKA